MHAFLTWSLSGLILGLGQLFIPLKLLVVFNLILIPTIAGLLARRFHQNFPGIQPVNAAYWFTGIIIFLNVALTAPVFEKSFSMFTSIIASWLPFALIFGAVLWAGNHTYKKTIRKTQRKS